MGVVRGVEFSVIRSQGQLDREFYFSCNLQPISTLPTPAHPQYNSSVTQCPGCTSGEVCRELSGKRDYIHRASTNQPTTGRTHQVPIRALQVIQARKLPHVTGHQIRCHTTKNRHLFIYRRSTQHLATVNLPIHFSIHNTPHHIRFSNRARARYSQPHVPSTR